MTFIRPLSFQEVGEWLDMLFSLQPKDPSLCARVGCTNAAVFAEERGPRYCSNKCVIEHCR